MEKRGKKGAEGRTLLDRCGNVCMGDWEEWKGKDGRVKDRYGEVRKLGRALEKIE